MQTTRIYLWVLCFALSLVFVLQASDARAQEAGLVAGAPVVWEFDDSDSLLRRRGFVRAGIGFIGAAPVVASLGHLVGLAAGNQRSVISEVQMAWILGAHMAIVGQAVVASSVRGLCQHPAVEQCSALGPTAIAGLALSAFGGHLFFLGDEGGHWSGRNAYILVSTGFVTTLVSGILVLRRGNQAADWIGTELGFAAAPMVSEGRRGLVLGLTW